MNGDSIERRTVGKLKVVWPYVRHPLIASCLIVAAVILGYEVFNRPSRHADLIRFTELARGVSSPDEVEELFTRMNSRVLTLDKLSDSRWRVVTPFELTANNWILYIDFNDGQLASLRIRTTDGPHDHPDSAPPDIVIENRR